MINIEISGAGFYRSETFHKGSACLTPLRSVDEYEIEFFREDHEYGYLNRNIVEYKKNTVIISKPGDVRQSKKHFSCYYIHAIIRDNTICNVLNELPSAVVIEDEAKYTQIFHNICSSFPTSDDSKRISAIGWLMILISSLSKDSKDIHQALQATSTVQRNAILSAKTYMDFNFNSDISLEDIANSIHMSPNYFHKLFTSTCGISPLQYLTSIRIEKAKSELMYSERSIAQIADSCGFNSYTYFCTVFKRNCGVTPGEFRKSGSKYYSI